ncbi:MAG: M1 family metallopeptidase, partial [Ginsengibacter sp.]
KLILPSPLLPGQTIKISTPFHEKIPFNFSRGGHVGHTYQITQWYPKPAVFDKKGWHPMPYLDQGEFYSEFGNFHVQITVPENYIVAATGELQNPDELNWLREQKAEGERQNAESKRQELKNNIESTLAENKKIKKRYQPTLHKNKKATASNEIGKLKNNNSHFSKKTKTLNYIQDNVHDFAWFANKNFELLHDTLQLASGKIIDVWSFFLPSDFPVWKNSIQFIKDAVSTRSKWLGEYPYKTVTAVEAKMGFSGGMEYPTITSISPMQDEQSLDMTIEHEVGHNWLFGILATNERQFPWMDEGMNTYFDNRYRLLKYSKIDIEKEKFLEKKLPSDEEEFIYRNQIVEKRDQPIETSSQGFSETNYGVIAYYKTGLWMKKLEGFVGKKVFDSCLREYYNRWKFKHPYPEDFKKMIEDISGKNVDEVFSLLSKKGRLEAPKKKEFKPDFLFNLNKTNKYNYLFLSPALGYNYYDKIMIGGLIHNYTLPEPKFHFFVAPLYSTGSKTFTGIARAGYNIMSYGAIRKAEISLSAEKASMDEFTDSTGRKNYLGFSKIVPSVKLIFRNKNANNPVQKWMQWKTYFINETQLSFNRDTILQQDIITYPKASRYLNQLNFTFQNNRVLNPYSSNLQIQQTNKFLRFSFEGKYFFNYPNGGGMNARLFAGKFMYLGSRTIIKQFETDRYHLNMTGANGYEDYTYSNYFVGRNEFEGAASQQIMMRDGGFKVRSDLLSNKIGKTDNWLTALNLTSDLPKKMNPFVNLTGEHLLKVFLDVGTYAEAWKKNSTTGKFLYDAGLQISLLKDLVNVYIPVLYSKIYSDYYKSTIPKDRLLKTISFSIDIQNFRLNKFLDFPDL